MGRLLSTENRIPREPWTEANAALNAALDAFAAQYPLTKTSAFIGWAAPGERSDSIFISFSESDSGQWHSSCSERMKTLAHIIHAMPDDLKSSFVDEFTRLTVEQRAAPSKPE